MNERAQSRPKPRSPQTIDTDIGYSTPDTITVRGLDLPNDLLGHINFGDMAFLEVMGRVPDEAESAVFNAVLVSLVEHGMTPSALSARLTYLGAPESIQASVAAGILGVGSVFVGTIEGSAQILSASISSDTRADDIPLIAAEIVRDARVQGKNIPGIGHPIHKPIDPRVPRLFDIAEDNDMRGHYVALMEAISSEANAAYNRQLPINATGAIGALLCELNFDIRAARGIGAMARSVGLVGHVIEEMDKPMAKELWFRVEDEVVERKANDNKES